MLNDVQCKVNPRRNPGTGQCLTVINKDTVHFHLGGWLKFSQGLEQTVMRGAALSGKASDSVRSLLCMLVHRKASELDAQPHWTQRILKVPA